MIRDILIIAFLVAAAYGLYLWLTGQDPESRLAREAKRMRQQNRSSAPVIYLRSFGSERLQFSDVKAAIVGNTIPGTLCYWKNAGDTVTDFLSVMGPVRALARPDKAFQLRPSAPSRPETVAVDDEHWQEQILEWLPGAALVVVQLDVSTGLEWELRQLVRRVTPTRILLVLPPTQGEYDRIRTGTSSLFPIALPEELPASRMLTFRPDWQPWPLKAAAGGGFTVWQTLEPVFEQNGYQMPSWRQVG